jgi:hypothetical protein
MSQHNTLGFSCMVDLRVDVSFSLSLRLTEHDIVFEPDLHRTRDGASRGSLGMYFLEGHNKLFNVFNQSIRPLSWRVDALHPQTRM